MIKKILKTYLQLPRSIHHLIMLQFFLNIIHVAFVLILNIYLRKKGFTDPQIANYNSLRFLGVLIFALPFGIFIRHRDLKPFFILSSFLVPFFSLLLINSIDRDLDQLIFGKEATLSESKIEVCDPSVLSCTAAAFGREYA